MIRVRAPSRLHFGLLRLPSREAGRHFGGVGLMIEEPGVSVCVERADDWSADGPLAERALDYARQFVQSLAITQRFKVTVETSAPEHAGLGTGTQLGLAVAKALAVSCGHAEFSALELAGRVSRGKRSALGIHGFAHGGFLVDGGKGATSEIAPLVSRADFPADWQIVIVLPQGEKGRHGNVEEQAFMNLQNGQTDVLCRLVLLGMLPALQEVDLPAFGEALYEFNCRVGEMFRPIQGGTYAHGRTAALVEYVRGKKIAGVGQSSWGPAIFAVVEKDRADSLAQCVREHFHLAPAEVLITRASQEGARVARVTERTTAASTHREWPGGSSSERAPRC